MRRERAHLRRENGSGLSCALIVPWTLGIPGTHRSRLWGSLARTCPRAARLAPGHLPYSLAQRAAFGKASDARARALFAALPDSPKETRNETRYHLVRPTT